jgi:predicted nucleic acid-binding protein
MPTVLDTSAVIAFLRREQGWEIVGKHIQDEGCVVHAINLCETYYDTVRYSNRAAALAAVADLDVLGVTVRQDMDTEFMVAVGDLKADNRLSLADCFVAALANRLDATVLTSDYREFAPLVVKGRCKVEFFR